MNQNAALWFVDRHVEEGRAAKVAFREAWEGGRSLSYGDLSERTGALAASLQRAGIRREERALMLVLDQIEFPIIFWGALKAGVQPIALNTLLTADVYAAILEDSRPAIAFISAELLDVVLPVAMASPHLREIVVIGENKPDGTLAWNDFVGGVLPRPALSCSADEIAFWLYSSGSTGTPKGVRHVHGALKVT